ncbi:uncharacterized protein BP5553_00129 [Venustampulla echinocandica]|uniref:Uncharacterized protein n=1 Tax=Venustampulla echinocandica TaxID=2656787 RepID=A0A370TXA0_9HELO|nr:uncharacterized protein BP5553_00129 [Venustampulla echinocandica]RDL40150.1 hypothetical protein BP5553_00129 [Venustampulla echinocandica]
MVLNKLIPTALVLSAFANAYIRPPITGHDFDFKAVYPSGLELSTMAPPKGILPPEEIPLTDPILTLINMDEEAKASLYIAFLEISRIPTTSMLDDVLYTFPWTLTNLTVLSNGTLAETNDTKSWHIRNEIDGGEVRNATMHVWRQTPELTAWMAGEDARVTRMPSWYTIAKVWSNTTDRVSKNFPKANIDFKIQNTAGDYRCDVDNSGAPISGISVGATTCTGAPTKVATQTSVRVTTTPTGATATGEGTKSNTATHGQVGVSFGWPAIASFILLHIFAASSI